MRKRLFFTLTKALFIVVFVMTSNASFGQIFQFNFENTAVVTTDNAVGTPTFTSTVGTTYSAATPCQGTRMFVHDAWDSNDYLQFTVNTTGYGNMTFSFCDRSDNASVGTFLVRVSADGGDNWTIVLNTFTPTSSNGNHLTGVFPASTNNQPEVLIQILKISNPNNNRDYFFDNATLNGSPMPTVTGFTPTTACIGTTVAITGTNFTGATSVQINGANVASYVVNSATSITATVASGNTTGAVTVANVNGSGSSAGNLTINPSPTNVTAAATASTICLGGTINLTASATSNSAISAVTLINENFNTANSWAKTNTSTGGTTANAAWTQRANGYSYTNSSGGNTVFHSNDNSQFYLSNSDAQGSGTTNTTLSVPTFSTIGLTSATLSYYQYYRYNGSESGTVEISTNGNNWVTLVNAPTGNLGTANGFVQVNASLASYLNQATVYIRFHYTASWDWYWAIDNVNVTGMPSAAPAPTYSWTSVPAGYTSALQNPSAVAPTVNTVYTVTATNSYGCTASASTVSVVVNPVAVAGTVTASTIVCPGTNSGTLNLGAHVGNVIRWESSLDAFATVGTPIANTTTSLTYTNLTATTSYRAVVQSGTCAPVYAAAATITVDANSTWTGANGTSWNDAANWSCGAIPTVDVNVTIAAVPNQPVVSTDAFAKSLVLQTGTTLLVQSGSDIRIVGAINGQGTSVLTIENNANLIQNEDVNNTGNAVVKRVSNALMRNDYIIWSAPVSGQNLLAFSPATLPNRFYTYNAATNLFNSVVPSTTDFAEGTGYLIRVKNTLPSTPTTWAGVFNGTLNNGDVNIPVMNNTFNAIGNPYPSTIDADVFIRENNITQALYFWRKTNNELTTSYATYTLAGGAATKANVGGDPIGLTPNGVIQVGQGFIAKSTSTNFNFNNGMRIGNNQNQTFRTNSVERNRIWLNLTNAEGVFSQTMVAYMTGATIGVDNAIDGPYFNDSELALTSMIGESEYAVQGRSLPFAASDIVPLGFKAIAAGTYTIGIDHMDGLFADATQAILLKDNVTNTTYDLRTGDYTFASETGVFNTRFEIVYQTTLATVNPTWDANQVIVYKQGAEDLVINTGKINMATVKVFDIRGRLLADQKNINATETKIKTGTTSQVLIVKIISNDGAEVTKKVVN